MSVLNSVKAPLVSPSHRRPGFVLHQTRGSILLPETLLSLRQSQRFQHLDLDSDQRCNCMDYTDFHLQFPTMRWRPRLWAMDFGGKLYQVLLTDTIFRRWLLELRFCNRCSNHLPTYAESTYLCPSIRVMMTKTATDLADQDLNNAKGCSHHRLCLGLRVSKRDPLHI